MSPARLSRGVLGCEDFCFNNKAVLKIRVVVCVIWGSVRERKKERKKTETPNEGRILLSLPICASSARLHAAPARVDMLAPGLLLFAPSGMVVFSPTRVPAIAAAPRPRATIALQAADGDEALGLAYRTLGIAEDATYDEITEAHIELSERYVGDSPRLAALDDAMERVVNEIMRRRLRGEMRPKVAIYRWRRGRRYGRSRL